MRVIFFQEGKATVEKEEGEEKDKERNKEKEKVERGINTVYHSGDDDLKVARARPTIISPRPGLYVDKKAVWLCQESRHGFKH